MSPLVIVGIISLIVLVILVGYYIRDIYQTFRAWLRGHLLA